MGEKMTLTGELKRKVYDEYLSLYDGDKDKALQDLGTFYLGWTAIEKGLTQPAQAVDVGAIMEVAYAIRHHRGDKAFYSALADYLTAALPNANGKEG